MRSGGVILEHLQLQICTNCFTRTFTVIDMYLPTVLLEHLQLQICTYLLLYWNIYSCRNVTTVYWNIYSCRNVPTVLLEHLLLQKCTYCFTRTFTVVDRQICTYCVPKSQQEVRIKTFRLPRFELIDQLRRRCRGGHQIQLNERSYF